MLHWDFFTNLLLGRCRLAAKSTIYKKKGALAYAIKHSSLSIVTCYLGFQLFAAFIEEHIPVCETCRAALPCTCLWAKKHKRERSQNTPLTAKKRQLSKTSQSIPGGPWRGALFPQRPLLRWPPWRYSAVLQWLGRHFCAAGPEHVLIWCRKLEGAGKLSPTRHQYKTYAAHNFRVPQPTPTNCRSLTMWSESDQQWQSESSACLAVGSICPARASEEDEPISTAVAAGLDHVVHQKCDLDLVSRSGKVSQRTRPFMSSSFTCSCCLPLPLLLAMAVQEWGLCWVPLCSNRLLLTCSLGPGTCIFA